MITSMRKYGWKRDNPDPRDFKYVPRHEVEQLPSAVDLSTSSLPILDQGQLGSCTANAIGSADMFCQIKQQQKAFIPSRLFIYYNERKMEGTINSDSGSQIRDGIKSINALGVCPESEWKYDVSKFKAKPPKVCYKHALEHQTMKYSSIDQNVISMKSCLFSGYPFVFGFTVPSSFESSEMARTGIMEMPKKNDQILGGHAVLAIGYDNSKRYRGGIGMIKVQNSWGATWGDHGYFWMPYDYISNIMLASDMWKIEVVE